MELISLLTGGSDNLYKYLFLGGLGLILLSLFYPLNKKYEYATQRDAYNNEVNLLNYEIEQLEKRVNDFSKQSDQIQLELESLNKASSKEKRRSLLKDSFLRQYLSIKSSRDSIKKKELAIKYNNVRISTVKDHIQDFTKYEKLFFWTGIFSAIAGIFGWYKRMRKQDSKAS